MPASTHRAPLFLSVWQVCWGWKLLAIFGIPSSHFFSPSVFSVFVVSRHFWMGAFLFTSAGGSSSHWASYRDIGGHFQLSMEDIFISSESEEEKRISHLLRVDKPGTLYKWSSAQRQLTQRDKPVAFSNINRTHLQPGSHTPRVKKLAGVCTFWPHSAKRSGGSRCDLWRPQEDSIRR